MNILFVMDDIASINPIKDTTLAMLEASQQLGYELYVCDCTNMWYESTKNRVFAHVTKISVDITAQKYYEVVTTATITLDEMQVIMMRKDPPFDMHYIYATYLLEIAQKSGVLVVNNPRSLRDFNEKMVLSVFPHLCVPTLISSNASVIEEFRMQFSTIILKPLDAMGGNGIYKKDAEESITAEVNELTNNGITPIMVQCFIPEISAGDKRIILIGGEHTGVSLARIPKQGDFKGNLAQGASYEIRDLTKRDKFICEEIRPFLVANGLDFVGIDVIGEYLTEINITSPTGVREIQQVTSSNIALECMEYISAKL